jgi:cold-inducible RNA-binding protein
MASELYVGNLPYTATEQEVRELFERVVTVEKVSIVKDRDTGNSKGFGFVQVPDEHDVELCIRELNGTELGGRPLTINKAKGKPTGPRQPDGNRSGPPAYSGRTGGTPRFA